MSTGTSSLRLARGTRHWGPSGRARMRGRRLGRGGTPMPAPDDPPPSYRTSTVKTSARRDRGAQGEAGMRSPRRRCRRPTPRFLRRRRRRRRLRPRSRPRLLRPIPLRARRRHRPPVAPRHRRVRVPGAPCARRRPPLARRSLRRVRRRSRSGRRSRSSRARVGTRPTRAMHGSPMRSPATARAPSDARKPDEKSGYGSDGYRARTTRRLQGRRLRTSRTPTRTRRRSS